MLYYRYCPFLPNFCSHILRSCITYTVDMTSLHKVIFVIHSFKYKVIKGLQHPILPAKIKHVRGGGRIPAFPRTDTAICEETRFSVFQCECQSNSRQTSASPFTAINILLGRSVVTEDISRNRQFTSAAFHSFWVVVVTIVNCEFCA